MITRAAIITASLLAASSSARACATCGGITDEHIVAASNSVLWTLLALVAFIFTATGLTAWFIYRRTTRPLTPES